MWGLCARVVLTTSLVFTWAWSVNSAWSCMYGSLSLCSHTFRHSKSGSQCQLQYIQQRHNQVKIALETHVGIYIHSLTWVTQCHLAHLSQPIQNTSVWITYWTHRYISLLELLSHITRDTLHCLVYDGRSLFQTRETAVLRSLLCGRRKGGPCHTKNTQGWKCIRHHHGSMNFCVPSVVHPLWPLSLIHQQTPTTPMHIHSHLAPRTWGKFREKVECPRTTVPVLIIIMYIYHALINALSTHMIHINLNMIF